MDTFELRKQVSSEAVFELSLDNKLFREIVKYKPIFKSMLSNLIDLDVLKKSEADPLIPFNNNFNLMCVNNQLEKA